MPTIVRSLRPDQPGDLDLFTDLAVDTVRNADVRAYLDRTISTGATRPEWCYVAEVDGGVVGRVAAWTLPPSDVPLDLVLLDVPWDEPDIRVGETLLRHILDDIRALGGERVGHVIDEPPREPFWQDNVAARISLLGRVGFRQTRETSRFELRIKTCRHSQRGSHFAISPLLAKGPSSTQFGWYPRGRSTRRSSKSASVRGRRARRGSSWIFSGKLRYEPSWWQLAYDAEGALVGLTMPCANPGAATIGYIGVHPEQRGKGYVDELMTQTTLTLHAAGYDRIVADTDLRNAPMAAAFVRAGYAAIGTRKEFAIELNAQMRRS